MSMVTTSINKHLCQHTVNTDDNSAIQSTMVWLGRRHLAFAVANGVLNRRFSVATVGRCGDGWKLRCCCRRGPQYDGKCPFYLNCYFLRTSPKNRDLREKAVYFPPQLPATSTTIRIISSASSQDWASSSPSSA